MSQQIISIGAAPDDDTGDNLRTAGDKINDNFSEVYAGLHWRGAHDLSANAYPSTGGSGSSGDIQSGDEWYVSVSGDLDVSGLGVITISVGALLKALVDTPGTTPANWKVIQ